MKKIGILGGMGPESTIEYYKRLIFLSRKKWEYKCPEIIIYNLNEEEWAKYIELNRDYTKALALLSFGINALHRAGADFVIMASNTPHIFFNELIQTSPLPLLNIAEETAKEAKRLGYQRVGLLGTKIVMGGEFYRNAFKKQKIQLFSPDSSSQDYIHEKIVKELVRGITKDETQAELIKLVKQFVKKNRIEAVVLGCTELPFIMSKKNLGVPVLNTVEIHAASAFNYALDS